MEKTLGKAVFFVGCFLSCTAFAEVEETPPTVGIRNTYEPLNFQDWHFSEYGTYAGGAASQTAGSAYSNYRAAEAKKEAKRQCKVAAVDQQKSCNDSKFLMHRLDSNLCSGAKWVGGALGVAGGWAAFEGEGAGSVLLAGAGMAIYQMGDDCQTDMDRVLDVNLASCATNKDLQDIKCDAIK